MPNFVSSAGQLPKAELQTIADYTNQLRNATPEKRGELYSLIEETFAKYAYTDQGPTHPPEQTLVREFTELNAPDLAAIAKDLGLGKHSAHRLIANILKVCRISPLGWFCDFPVTEIHIYDDTGEDIPLFWGWIDERYVDASLELARHINDDEKIVFREGEMEPFTLLAIQRLQEVIENIKMGRSGADLPFQMFIAAALFAKQWKIIPMLQDLAQITTVWRNHPTKERQEEIEHTDQLYGDGVDFEFVKDLLAEIDGHATMLPNPANVPDLRIDVEDDLKKTWFDESHPIDSIVQFAARCCSLSSAEQCRFINATRKFFTDKYHTRSTIAVPEDLKGRFTLICLPFLIKAMNDSSAERSRFIKAVHQVTRFSLLKDLHASDAQFKLTIVS